jgi:hypothetical protein
MDPAVAIRGKIQKIAGCRARMPVADSTSSGMKEDIDESSGAKPTNPGETRSE